MFSSSIMYRRASEIGEVIIIVISLSHSERVAFFMSKLLNKFYKRNNFIFHGFYISTQICSNWYSFRS